MLKKISIIISLVLCVLAAAPVFAVSGRVAELRTGSYQASLLEAINKSFNQDAVGADASLRKALEMEPDNPMAYALEAMLHLFAYEMCFTLAERQKEREAIISYSEAALSRGEKRLAEYPRDSRANLAVGLAKIAKVHWAIKEKKYLVMVQETSRVWKYLETAKAADPYNHDVDFLMGLLHYHIDHFPGVTGFLSSQLITKGDRQKGLQEIQTAAQKGYLLKDIAQVELATVYLSYERQPAKALPVIQELNRRFPDNYNFYFTLAVTLAELKRFAEAEAVAAKIDKNISTGAPSFVPELRPRYYQLLGRIHFNRGEYGRAESNFQKAMQDKSFYNIRTMARSLLYLGMIHDIRQERKYAEDYYNRVLNVEGADGAARLEAAAYLKIPFHANGK
jgi:tetratricopeptide (TPR) repeat protein